MPKPRRRVARVPNRKPANHAACLGVTVRRFWKLYPDLYKLDMGMTELYSPPLPSLVKSQTGQMDGVGGPLNRKLPMEPPLTNLFNLSRGQNARKKRDPDSGCGPKPWQGVTRDIRHDARCIQLQEQAVLPMGNLQNTLLVWASPCGALEDDAGNCIRICARHMG